MKNSIMFTINSWYILIPLFLLTVLYIIVAPNIKRKKYGISQYFLLFTFVFYIFCVIHLVFFPIDVNIGIYANQTKWYNTINFIPVLTIDFFTFVLNIIMFVPLGVYLFFIGRKNFTVKQTAKTGFILSLVIEIIQMIIRIMLGSGRSSDINDLLANTIGAIVGYLIIKNIYKIKKVKNVFTRFQLNHEQKM
ncbi:MULTISPECIES: VanZ family protein [Bacillaceae]|uniref:Teicoplanin resistance protein VanZ n=1 Tax=Gottfriedia luciferensis TaxID=178774 RepID=A0ABX2ZMK6_9BACI|nr:MULTISPECIES: VanZ family protein [Bacillaceae]ODG90951.1 teicoplanin resistance protein VanZ [Gottfriedia luciferensis]PGZ94393.1 VanZ family protein [Bacillus sp. AFS029533]